MGTAKGKGKVRISLNGVEFDSLRPPAAESPWTCFARPGAPPASKPCRPFATQGDAESR